MKVGEEVRYYGPDGESRRAEIADIAGAGPSLNKRLDLWLKGISESEDDGGTGKAATIVEKVPHEIDADEGEHFWMMKGERRTRRAEMSVEDVEAGTDRADVPAPRRKAGK